MSPLRQDAVAGVALGMGVFIYTGETMARTVAYMAEERDGKWHTQCPLCAEHLPATADDAECINALLNHMNAYHRPEAK